MIYLATQELLDKELASDLAYVARSFDLPAEQVVLTPPDGLPIILLQQQDGRYVQGEESLVDFSHPDECTYLLGQSHGQLTLDYDVAYKLFIPSVPTWSMFTSQATAIVLYDRLVKRGSFG